MEHSKLSSTCLILVLLIASLLILDSVGANQPNFADCMKNPFASGCRGISAKRSQLGAVRTSQLGDGRGGGELLPNTRYRDSGQLPPMSELMIANRWLLAECAAMRLPLMVDLLQASLNLQQQQQQQQGAVERNSNR